MLMTFIPEGNICKGQRKGSLLLPGNSVKVPAMFY